MNQNEYQAKTNETAIYKESILILLAPLYKLAHEAEDAGAIGSLDKIKHLLMLSYVALGLVGEAGEVAEKVKKHIRSGANLEGVPGELGDVGWYRAQMASLLGLSLSEVDAQNIEKLFDRKGRDVLKGSGDNR